MTAEQIVLVHLADGRAEQGTPSYELPMHLAIYRSRPEVGAIVHTHAPYVTALSVLRRPLPPIIVAIVMESCARVYVEALKLGEPAALPHEALAAGRRMYEARYKL